MELNLSNKSENINGKDVPVYSQVEGRQVIALKRQIVR